jgi:hypothetical protein
VIPLDEMNTALMFLLEGCLQEEFVPRRCRRCGAIFEIEVKCCETLCHDCKGQPFLSQKAG